RRSLPRGRRAGPGAVRRQRQARERGRDPRAAGRRRGPGRRRQPRSRGPRPDRRGRARVVSMPGGPGAPPLDRVCLIVLDGWGLAEAGPGNAVELGETPNFDELLVSYPHSTLTAWGPAVGLPEGQMGNSEVGHLNLGAGAIVKQDITRIDEAIEDGSFAKNEALRAACAAGREAGRLHLL